MGRRKSIITGIRKRPNKIATVRGSAMGSLVVDSAPSPSRVSASKPRQLLSIQSTRSENPLSSKRKADTIGPGSKGAQFLRLSAKQVSQGIIRSTWRTLDGGTQAKVEELLLSIELPVLASYSSEQRKIEAQIALRSITGTLYKRLPRMLFPPKETYFDYERLAKDIRILQQSLASLVTSSASISNQLKKQKLALSSERQELEDVQ